MVALSSTAPRLAPVGATPKFQGAENVIATLVSSDNFGTKILSEAKSWIDLTGKESVPFSNEIYRAERTMKASKGTGATL